MSSLAQTLDQTAPGISNPKQGDGTSATMTLYLRALGKSRLSQNMKAVATAHAKGSDYGTGANSRLGYKRIARDTGLSERTVKRLTAELRKLGWLYQVRAGHGTLKLAAVWQVTIPLNVNAGRAKVSKPKCQNGPSPHSLQNDVTETSSPEGSSAQPVDIERNLYDAGVQSQRDLIERMNASAALREGTVYESERTYLHLFKKHLDTWTINVTHKVTGDVTVIEAASSDVVELLAELEQVVPGEQSQPDEHAAALDMMG